MPPVLPLPTPVSALAPSLLLPSITVSPSFPYALASRSIQPFTAKQISFILHRRSSNESPESHALCSLLFITLRRLLDSSLDLLLSNRSLVHVTLDSGPIAKRFTEGTLFGLFDPSYFLFAGFGGGECDGGRVPFGVPIQISVLLPAADGCGMLAVDDEGAIEDGGDARAMRL